MSEAVHALLRRPDYAGKGFSAMVEHLRSRLAAPA
jgi:hypothetical protein